VSFQEDTEDQQPSSGQEQDGHYRGQPAAPDAASPSG
jgi:hypothetical protein